MRRAGIKMVLMSVGLCIGLSLSSQSKVVVKAMKDEIDRNLKGLKLEGFDDPFFISYKLNDFFTDSYHASWGSGVRKEKDSLRMTSVRLMVGNYEFNDESLEEAEEVFPDYTDDVPYYAGPMGVPLGDDYSGIRLDFWTSTESIYRTAARKFKSYRERLEKEGKQIDDVLHREFKKAPAEKYWDDPEKLKYDESVPMDLVKMLSAKLEALDWLDDFRISLIVNKKVNYFISTEGAEIVQNHISFNLSVALMEPREKSTTPHLFTFETPELAGLKDHDAIWQKLQGTIDKILNVRKSVSLEEPYDGPILFLGKSFGNALRKLNLTPQFAYSLNVDTTKSSYSYQYGGMVSSLEKRLGKRVTSRNLSVIALPSLTEFNGTKISSGYQFDREGLRAPDSLLLVENGVLKGLTSERNVLKEGVTPNGTASGLGTILMRTAFSDTEEELRQKLIDLAEDEGLDFAIIAKGNDDMFSDLEFYRVDIETGAEQLLKGAGLTNFSFNKLRKLAGANTEMMVNTKADLYGSYFGEGATRMTVIHPSAMLLTDLEIRPDNTGSYSEVYGSNKKFDEFPVPDPRKRAGKKK